MQSRREKKKSHTQTALVQNALSLFVEKGFDATTIADICDKTDLAVGTFYNYFKSKEDLLHFILADKIKGISDRILAIKTLDVSYRGKIEYMFLYFYSFYENNKQLMDMLISSTSSLQAPHGIEFKEILTNIITSGQQAGEFNAKLPIPIVTELFLSVFTSSITSKLDIPVKDNLKQKMAVFFDGICN